MRLRYYLLKVIVFILPINVFAQSTFITEGTKEYHFVDRLEIKNQDFTNFNFSAIKPYSRKSIVDEATFFDTSHAFHLSKVDQYQLKSLFMNNKEWYSNTDSFFYNKKPLLQNFYITKSNLFEVNQKDFFLVVNPVIGIEYGKENNTNKKLFLHSRGVTIRGIIANKIGFAASITDNQERGPSYFQQQIATYKAVPGVGFYKDYKDDPTANDYFDARGYFTFNFTKYINFQIGHDKNFIGDGYRSLFLSDCGNSYLFTKINTKIWKLNYQNLFMELMPQFSKKGDSLISRKYAAIHHLSMNVTKWLNIGLFEGIVFGRKDHFDFQYLNPIIFYRHIEGSVGSPDNALAGMDFKANALHRFQFYGQFLLDEFILSRIKDEPTNWANKYGFQLGAKYIDVLGVKNLDLQLEWNRVRPFTYTHSDSISNYTHYNQPLAHPLGANFNEIISIVNYQPYPKLNIDAKLIFYTKGMDSVNTNFGGNIFKDYTTRSGENDFYIGSGDKATCINASLNVAYEIIQNTYLECGIQYRNYKLQTQSDPNNSTSINIGLRMNLNRRVYDY